ncbi:MAG: NAD(P)/FAD-dependent oxidoreductase [Bacteroidales bacterium]|nr:NAD(P)/FAD-dependent oxidoreductase [Bacteroidales bacterium]
MHTNYDLIIVGAGAAGLMAATVAAEKDKKILLIEKMDQAGRKLRITGKGRCNLTNTSPLKDFITHLGSDGRFMRNAFSKFFSTELMTFFEQKGVPLNIERGSRVFPKSGKSLDVFLALIKDLERNRNITILKNTSVARIVTTTEGRVVGVELKDKTLCRAPKVIMATGGKSYPSTGSEGEGYEMLKQLGHTIVQPVPSLVPLVTKEPIPEELIGFQLKNVSLAVMNENGGKIGEYFGEMTFTPNGVAGPIVLSVSRLITRMVHEGKNITLKLDLKPALDVTTLDKKLIRELNENGTRVLKDALRLWLPAEMIPLALSNIKIEHYKRLNQINANERKMILNMLKNIIFHIESTRGWDEAIVTQGGVNLKEVNPKTMESKIVEGLYIVGELLDLDADTGGYNLQIAFSTAYMAANDCFSKD